MFSAEGTAPQRLQGQDLVGVFEEEEGGCCGWKEKVGGLSTRLTRPPAKDGGSGGRTLEAERGPGPADLARALAFHLNKRRSYFKKE